MHIAGYGQQDKARDESSTLDTAQHTASEGTIIHKVSRDIVLTCTNLERL